MRRGRNEVREGGRLEARRAFTAKVGRMQCRHKIKGSHPTLREAPPYRWRQGGPWQRNPHPKL